MTKQCFKCGKRKPRTSFYKHSKMADGLLGKCKTCTKSDVAAYRRKKTTAYVIGERARNRTPARVLSARLRHRRNYEQWPGKIKARNAINNAIRDGKLQRKPCERCGEAEAQGHHTDYRKRLQVTWLCAPCHGKEHRTRAA